MRYCGSNREVLLLLLDLPSVAQLFVNSLTAGRQREVRAADDAGVHYSRLCFNSQEDAEVPSVSSKVTP